jgi:hypothetical protein
MKQIDMYQNILYFMELVRQYYLQKQMIYMFLFLDVKQSMVYIIYLMLCIIL